MASPRRAGGSRPRSAFCRAGSGSPGSLPPAPRARSPAIGPRPPAAFGARRPARERARLEPPAPATKWGLSSMRRRALSSCWYSSFQLRETGARGAQALANARYRQARLARDLFQGHAVDQMHDRDGLGACRQRVIRAEELGQEIARQRPPIALAVRGSRDLHQLLVVGVLGPPPFRAHAIQAHIGGDAQEQRRGCLVLQAVLMTQQGHEDVLHRVLRLCVITQQRPTTPQDHWTVPLVKAFDIEWHVWI